MADTDEALKRVQKFLNEWQSMSGRDDTLCELHPNFHERHAVLSFTDLRVMADELDRLRKAEQ